MKTLHPPIAPYAHHMLNVDTVHTVYIEECGNPHGLPVLFVHGGPGAGCTEDDRRFFDPERYHIILFDQRGSGRSTPHASLEGNNTAALIEDIEAIRNYLKISSWVLFGGSWGSTLSLLYAQKFPQYVTAMILRGIFLCTKRDLHWFYQNGANHIFPDYWEEFIKPIPVHEQNDLIAAYYKRLMGDDDLIRMSCAKHWSEWEGKCATLHPCKEVLERFSNPHTALSLARIEAHFFKNHTFIEPDHIILNADKLVNIPGTIIHGRYDMICPLENAVRLQKAWPNSELHIIRDGGHSAHEPGITDALIDATTKLVEQLA